MFFPARNLSRLSPDLKQYTGNNDHFDPAVCNNFYLPDIDNLPQQLSRQEDWWRRFHKPQI